MMNRIQRLRRNESGMSYVFIGLSMMAFISASMLAIDVGMLMTARSQAQNSADAGALAGATSLLYDSYTDRSAGGPAVTNAIRGSQMNAVMSGQVSVGPADVEFPNNPTTGEPNRVKVGKISKAQIRAIAEQKMPDLNAHDVDQAAKIIEGTARSMGVDVT